jgi:RNA polymerase sigma-70 factor (ECF subfamily)
LQEEPADAVEALTLHVWEGLTYEEIAIALEIPVGTVRSRISRVRDRLRKELAAHRHTLTSTSAEDGVW